MKLTDSYTDQMTLQPMDAGDSLGLYVKYRDDAHGVDSSLGVNLDDHNQQQLLREWLAIRFKQQGHGELAKALRRVPADFALMEKVLAFVAVEVSS